LKFSIETNQSVDPVATLNVEYEPVFVDQLYPAGVMSPQRGRAFVSLVASMYVKIEPEELDMYIWNEISLPGPVNTPALEGKYETVPAAAFDAEVRAWLGTY
jgi:hypothetical protein